MVFFVKQNWFKIPVKDNQEEGWDQRFASYRVHDKWIEEMTDLPFPFEDGRCLTMQNPVTNADSYTLMCAPEQIRLGIYKSPKQEFILVEYLNVL